MHQALCWSVGIQGEEGRIARRQGGRERQYNAVIATERTATVIRTQTRSLNQLKDLLRGR